MAPRLKKTDLQRLALEIRKVDLDELDLFQPLCPYELARKYGVDVIASHELAAVGCPAESVAFFTTTRPDAWSAALVPAGTGQFIVENTAHLVQRRRSNIAHEMAHVALEHEFDRVMFGSDTNGGGCHNPANKDQEWEATELGAELLIPKDAAYRAARKGMDDAAVAARFQVSERLAGWRMHGTGARKVAERIAAKWTRPRR